MLRGLYFSTIYPNPAQPSLGIFSQRRQQSMSDSIDFQVVAPVHLAKNIFKLGQIPLRREELYPVHHPRFLVLPKIAKGLDGWMLYQSTKSLVRRIITNHRPDFIEAGYGYPDGYAGFLHARNHHLPFILSLLGSDMYLLPKHQGRREKIRRVIRQAHGIIALSQDLRQRAMDLGADPNTTVVIGNGVDNHMFTPQSAIQLRKSLAFPENCRILLAVGRMVGLKRFDLTLRCLAELRHSHGVEAAAIVVGDGPEKKHLQKLAEELGITEFCRFPGRQSPETMPQWYNLADILLITSTHEGSPNVCLEALSCGTFVISFPVGDCQEIITADNGIIIPSAEGGQLAAAVAKTLNKGLPSRESISKSVDQRTWEQTAAEQVSFYNHILGKDR